jgi:hypothetical protein
LHYSNTGGSGQAGQVNEKEKMIFQLETPLLDKNTVLHYLGKQGAGRTGRGLSSKIDASLDLINKAARPMAYLRTVRIHNSRHGVVNLDGDQQLKSPKLARTLRDCVRAVCFVATAGAGLDGEIARLNQQGKVSQAYVADAIGSLLIERAVDDFQEQAALRLRRNGKEVSLRFSPGYCDWPVTQQKSLFEFLSPEAIGVELSETCLMNPRKSISGVFGAYDLGRADVAQPYNPCVECSKKNCTSRRAPARAA